MAAPKRRDSMLVFLFKQIMSVRKAIIGRNEPAQLAWGVAFGVLLGVVPHGNLLAIALLILLLSLRVNHGVATLAAVAATFLATRLDPYSHQVGRFVLTHEDLSRHIANAWQLPFVPWTDINNTIVTGSLIIGVAALVPIFLFTYPIFHFFAPKGTPLDDGREPSLVANAPVEFVEIGATKSVTPRTAKFTVVSDEPSSTTTTLAPSAIDAAMTGMGRTDAQASHTSVADIEEPRLVETRIDVIRIAKRPEGHVANEVEATDVSKQDEPMSEALRYLLRQVREANRRSAA
jgi:uncharacterized protein (TIGR03546 family)